MFSSNLSHTVNEYRASKFQYRPVSIRLCESHTLIPRGASHVHRCSERGQGQHEHVDELGSYRAEVA